MVTMAAEAGNLEAVAKMHAAMVSAEVAGAWNTWEGKMHASQAAKVRHGSGKASVGQGSQGCGSAGAGTSASGAAAVLGAAAAPPQLATVQAPSDAGGSSATAGSISLVSTASAVP